MRLSELAALVEGDPEVFIEDQHGIPRPIKAAEPGMTDGPAEASPYVLEPERGDD